MNRLPYLTLALALAAILAHVSPALTAWLQYDRLALGDGQVWRWFTGHLAHFGANHLVWDVSVFVSLGWICERESRTRFALALALSAFAASAALWYLQPHFAFYRGLSGLDCTLFGLLAGRLWRDDNAIARATAAAVSLGLIAKCGYETLADATIFARGGGYAPVPLAHLVGFLGGGLVGLLRRMPVIFRSPAAG